MAGDLRAAFGRERFLASTEARVSEHWKRAILSGHAEDAVKVDFAEHIVPRPTDGGWLTTPRALRTPFINTWLGRPHDAAIPVPLNFARVMAALAEGRAHEYLPLVGQCVGAIGEILPAADILQRIVTEAQQMLDRATNRPA